MSRLETIKALGFTDERGEPSGDYMKCPYSDCGSKIDSMDLKKTVIDIDSHPRKADGKTNHTWSKIVQQCLSCRRKFWGIMERSSALCVKDGLEMDPDALII